MKTYASGLLHGYCLLLCCCTVLASCYHDEEVIGHVERTNRTVLYYMAADNRLAATEDMQAKAEALAAAWHPGRGENHLVIYLDTGGDTPPRLLEVMLGAEGSANSLRVVQEYKSQNSASNAVFRKVLSDVLLGFPNVDYGLVMCSPGSGWLPEGTFTQSRSVAQDGNRELELSEFAAAIPDGQFLFILFESSHMAGVEVAYELKDKARYIVASAAEVLSPGYTPLYDVLLATLYTQIPPLEEFAQACYDYYKEKDGVTISVIDAPALAPVKYVLSDAESRVEHWEYVERSDIQHFDRRRENYLFYDLADYLRVIGTEAENTRLEEILGKALIYHAASDAFLPKEEYGFSISSHCGLTVYIPWAQFTFMNGERRKLKLFTE